ncbi:uncharacterized protein LTR77_010095 [Saxophila tyrrhenica]|uniref:Uncharacterized protein n=1 Tax=Saxophila tyrrhenica TaxID=1690608 RepID=A0AAV9NWU4_9PEZI|nr:hypothetical protein LTR77_010095 [Saxophila tyrrhenica]
MESSTILLNPNTSKHTARPAQRRTNVNPIKVEWTAAMDRTLLLYQEPSPRAVRDRLEELRKEQAVFAERSKLSAPKRPVCNTNAADISARLEKVRKDQEVLLEKLRAKQDDVEEDWVNIPSQKEF